ncbi:MAG: DUF2505 domain-containing protein [Nocardioides sp.]|nr:DUF2505 domain-containing protein [Nocardioides sp.]
MSKRMTYELTYDAPLADVAAMLGDPAFREQVCTDQRVLSSDVTIEEVGGVRQVTIDQTQAAEGIASFAKKFVGETIHIVQTESWTSADQGTIEMTTPGKPGDIRGTIALVESGGVTTETVDMEIKIGIPLVGGKIEGLIGDLLRRALKAENRVGRDYLSR